MAERFVEVDRNTPMLLPAELRDWVPEDDLVHFVIEAVKTLLTGEFVVNERGTGYGQYPPSMMLALLIYGYANGIFSRRGIERATYRDLGVRFLTGDTHPFAQAYNAQLAVDADGSQLVLGAYVSQSSADNNELEPMLAAVSHNLGQKPQAVLADRGYINGPIIEQIQSQGIEAYVALSAEAYERRP